MENESLRMKRSSKTSNYEGPLPTLISLNEFIFSVRDSHYVETLGGFSYWIKHAKGIHSKASEQYWRTCLKEYLERKL